MSTAFFVYPHQLFEENFLQSIYKNSIFYLIEEPLYFTQYKFHQHKLVFHRASMKCYQSRLKAHGITSTYFEFSQLADSNSIITALKNDSVTKIYYRELHDDWLERKVKKTLLQAGVAGSELDSPMFLSTKPYLQEYFRSKEKFFMADFYTDQRKKYNILMEGKKPAGGRWSFDEENRKKLPKNIQIPKPYFPVSTKEVTEAIDYVQLNFPLNPGKASSFRYAVDHSAALDCLQDFIDHRFTNFGAYEDAISYKDPFLFHSILTPYLNSGLLTPVQVLEAILNAGNIPINSKEGYIRQLIGWREYMRACYELKGRSDRTSNFWNHTREIPYSFWTANTGIIPVDSTITKALDHGFTHHIERLMVMGNFFLLCEFDPHEIYRWFMEMYIDAYDWVMVPNVYSMSQFASGGTTTTKPYLSSSNYILKMSDFGKGDWSVIWDALYWRFIHKHQQFFSSNPRLGVMVKILKQMDPEKLERHLQIANKYLKTIN